MALWTDVIDPETLTGYARASMADYEAKKGTLARWLPNRTVPDIVARFVAGASGLTDVAPFRSYDAEPAIGSTPTGKRVTLELPALGLNIPVSEYNQLRAMNANMTEAQILSSIHSATDATVKAVADSMERLRGIVLNTGKATIAGFSEDDFGRKGAFTNVAPAGLWSVAASDALTDLNTWCDAYRDENGEDPGAIVASSNVIRALASLNQFRNQLASGSTRPASKRDVNDVLIANDLPPIVTYDRRVSVAGSATRVLASTSVLLLPAAVEPDAWQESQLGATFWGRTLTATEPDWDIAEEDQAGVVTGVYRAKKPPMIAEVIADAIGMPVLANANMSFQATVL
jgi:hypothetical protein